VTVPATVGFVMLGVRDLPRMWSFFRQFGRPEARD